MKLPTARILDFVYQASYASSPPGDDPAEPAGHRDGWGYDDGARALPSYSRPTRSCGKASSRRTLATPPNEITAYGQSSRTSGAPANARGAPGQDWSAAFGNRFGKFGIVASVTHQYDGLFVEEAPPLLPYRGRR